jgi:hypothetical protein
MLKGFCQAWFGKKTITADPVRFSKLERYKLKK